MCKKGSNYIPEESLQLKQLETLAKTGIWEINLKTDEIKWSDGVYRILEEEPQAFKINFDIGLSFLHPDDRERSVAHFKEVLEKKNTL
jgi:hypothetical protein